MTALRCVIVELATKVLKVDKVLEWRWNMENTRCRSR